MKPQGEWIELPTTVIVSIISPEHFARVQHQLDQQKRNSPRNNANPELTLLRCGLSICGYCGANTQVEFNRSRNTIRYTCPVAKKGYKECIGISVKGELADVAAWERAIKIIRDPRLVEIEVAKRRKEDPTADQIEAAKAAIAKLAPAIQNLVETITETPAGEGRKIMTLRLEELAKERLTFQMEIDQLNRLRSQWHDAQQKIDEFEAWCNHARQHLDNPDYVPTYSQKREALEYLGIRALLYRVDHKPHIEIEVSPPEVMAVFRSAF